MEFENRYLDINGVRYVFQVIKEKINSSKSELMGEITSNMENLGSRIGEVEMQLETLQTNLGDNYYTKTEVNELLPTEIEIEKINEAYKQ